MSLLPLPFNIVLELFDIAVRQKSYIKDILIGKEKFKLSLFGDTIPDLEILKDSTIKFLEAIDFYSKVQATKLIDKGPWFLYR